jgi:hypothetical protein
MAEDLKEASNVIELTGAFYYVNQNDYSPLGEKPSYRAARTAGTIPDQVRRRR